MANPRKFSEKIALHNQKQAEETAAFEKIMREVSDATNKVNSNSRRARVKVDPEPTVTESSLRPAQPGLGTFRSGSLPNVAAQLATYVEPEAKPDEENLAPQCSALNFNSFFQPEEATLANQYGIGGGGGGGGGGGRSGGTSPSRVPGQRGRASSSVGPMRTRPVERRHDTSPYGSTVYLSPPPDSSWRRTNSDSALHQSCGGGGEQQPPTSLSPHHPLHSHAHPHHNTLMSHRRAADIHIDTLVNMGVNANSRPRSSCEILRLPNNTNTYEAGGGGGGGNSGGGGGGTLSCGELQVPGGSLPDLTSVHFPQPYPMPHRTHHHYPHNQSPTSPGAVSPGGGSVSPATGGLSPASGSPVGATVPTLGPLDALNAALRQDNASMYDTQNMSPLDHNWIASSYQSHCSPPSQYSSTSNINIPSPTMVHSPGSPAESPQTDYSNIHQALLQPFEQITMLDQPTSNYNSTYINHSSPHSPQTTNSTHTYSQSPHRSSPGVTYSSRGPGHCRTESRERDPVPGGNGPAFPPLSALSPPPNSIPDIILTDYSGELEAGIFGGEEAQLRAGLDLDELTLLEEPSSLLPDSSVEHEFRLDRL